MNINSLNRGQIPSPRFVGRMQDALLIGELPGLDDGADLCAFVFSFFCLLPKAVPNFTSAKQTSLSATFQSLITLSGGQMTSRIN